MRDCILRLCLHAYPAASRVRDGRAIIDLARELSAKGRLAFLREAAGMLVGGLGARTKLVWVDFTGAPWRAALERLALPLAVAMLCLFVGFVVGVYPGAGNWMGWWPLVGLIGGVAAVVGVAARRRPLTVVASLLLLGVLAWDAFHSLETGESRWWGNVYIGELNVLAMWLPVPLLLSISAWTVGRTGLRRGRAATWWMISAPVVVTAVGCFTAWRLMPSEWAYPQPLGGVFIWIPLALVIAAVVQGVIRKDPVTKTAAGMLVLAAVLPFMWAFAMVLREPFISEQYILVTYWLPGIILAFVILLLLLRRREKSPENYEKGILRS
jgi:hypothetical protein